MASTGSRAQGSFETCSSGSAPHAVARTQAPGNLYGPSVAVRMTGCWLGEPKRNGRARPRRDRQSETRIPRPMTAKAPNVLIVMADQMAPAFLPIYGHPLTRAPNMEALAQHGVVFDSAYCNSPLCSPSRASFMSGLLPSRTRGLRQCGGVRSRRSNLRPLLETSWLSYYLIGKNAFLRAGSTAWIRRAADDRHLSGRLRLDPGLGPSGASAELVSQHELGPRGRRLRADQSARLRRRNRLHGRASDLRHRALEGSPAVSARRLVHPSARPLCDPAALLGSLSRCRHRHARARHPRRTRSIRIRAGCAMFARWTPSR